MPAARADSTDDLLEVLRAKGILTQQEYDLLRQRNAAQKQAPPPATAAAPPPAPAPGAPSGAPFVTMMEKGVGVRIGPVDFSVSGEVNAFYVHDSPDKGAVGTASVAGGLASQGGATNSSSIRNGLLPGNFSFKLATKQEGYDIGVTFGLYPGLNSNRNTNGVNIGGGNATGLGTSGLDFRQQFITFGTDRLGTFKLGRDIGLFGQEAILNDFTLLGVGSTGGNIAPSNTSLGRIGLGYIYTDFIPQITYTTPSFAGLQGAIGIFTPLDAANFSGLSGTLSAHDQPQVQAKVTYELPKGMLGPVGAKFWANGITQELQSNGVAVGNFSNTGAEALPAGSGTRAWGADFGTKLSAFGADLVGYGYMGDGIGSTALFFDAVTAAGAKRHSAGYYVQLTYTLFDRLTVGGSYGLSHLSAAAGDAGSILFRNNSSEVVGAQYKLTDWLKLVTEFTHTNSKAQNGNSATSNSVAAGSILFF